MHGSSFLSTFEKLIESMFSVISNLFKSYLQKLEKDVVTKW